MTTPLPAAGNQTSDNHMAISRRFIQHAKDELAKDNRLQASEKVWGAAAHALKSIAVQRGWYHDQHRLITEIAIQLASEFDRPDFEITTLAVESLHTNFYSNRLQADLIERAIGTVEQFVDDLDEVRSSPPRPFQVSNPSEQARLRDLLGRRVQPDESSEDGFVNHRRLAQQRRRRQRRNGNGATAGESEAGSP